LGIKPVGGTRKWIISLYFSNGVHIIDLVQTAQLMEEAYTYMRSAEQGREFPLGTKDKQLGLWRKKPPVVVLTTSTSAG